MVCLPSQPVPKNPTSYFSLLQCDVLNHNFLHYLLHFLKLLQIENCVWKMFKRLLPRWKINLKPNVYSSNVQSFLGIKVCTVGIQKTGLVWYLDHGHMSGGFLSASESWTKCYTLEMLSWIWVHCHYLMCCLNVMTALDRTIFYYSS